MSKKIESVEDDAGKVTRYRRHPNGGGLVGPGAEVEESSFIGSTTYIEAGACVGSGCRIGDGSWIDRRAKIGDLAFIGDGVYVGEGTIVGNRVRIGSHSRIGAGAQVGHGTTLDGDSRVPDGGLVAVAAKPHKARRSRARHHQSRMAA
ncbi:transferase [Arthrobacter sp.]|uniref:transferase n=1 Tax=Arthrobacter sp. TaxID=1667 RepID=UPI0028119AC6|nr:transferase [Arthrobacter sp.]